MKTSLVRPGRQGSFSHANLLNLNESQICCHLIHQKHQTLKLLRLVYYSIHFQVSPSAFQETSPKKRYEWQPFFRPSGEWLLFSGRLLTVGENHRSVIALVIIPRHEERAFFIGRCKMLAVNQLIALLFLRLFRDTTSHKFSLTNI